MPKSEPRAETALPSYWHWFIAGSGGRPGWQRFLDKWAIVHLLLGITLAWLVPVNLSIAAQSVLIPLAGIFIGMSFAWVGNVQALIQSPEIELLIEKSEEGFESYIYTFQSAVLVLLLTLVLWGIAGLNVFDRQCFWSCPHWTYDLTEAGLFALASVTIRECWHVVLGAHLLLVAQRKIKRLQRTQERT